MTINPQKSLLLGFAILISNFLFCFEQAFSDQPPRESENTYTVTDFQNEFRFATDSSSRDAVISRQTGGDAYLKVKELKGVSFEHARTYYSDVLFSINSLYRQSHSPYPGALSNKINCPDDFKPRRFTHASFDYYVMYANRRFNYGVCLWDLIEYKAILYPLYCPLNQTFYQIELFVPKNKDISPYQEALLKLSCGS